MLGFDEALHGDRAQIGDVELVSRLERLDGCRIERDRKPGGVVERPRKTASAALPSARACASVNSGSRPAAVFFSTTSSPPIA